MYKHILVAIDGSPTSDAALKQALRLARLTQGSLRLIHVIDELSCSNALGAYADLAGDHWKATLGKEGLAVLDAALAVAQHAGVPAETVLVDNFGAPVHERVIDMSVRWPADLIVLGTHGRRGISRAWFGSTAETIVRRATMPVLVVRSKVGAPT